ncbi:cobyric acid synthase [Thermophagus sp. OGC60D27]|uniref:cobyric acid synthase n=1 Tax=Thermophagus sp. OGC60D27 TaxID=3458415 RepID=UPI0040382DD2
MQALKHPLMIVGTGSDVGKSVLATGFCRIFLQDGYRPVPFKAQNMSLNSYVTADGGEMGRAQAVQAEACRLECHTDMNPVLLKPGSDKQSQVIVNGKVLGNYSAGSYFRGEIKGWLFEEVMKAFKRLQSQYNPVVIEGAGSIAELNLKNNDIVNMRMATAVNAATILVADIERGGVFASVYGSIKLLSPEERKCIKGIIINKFRGDISLFDEGKKIIEELTGVPVLGVVPAFRHIRIEEEDSVSLARKAFAAVEDKINVAVILLRRLSNFTDFNRLEQEEKVNLFYTNNVEEIRKADLIILPGSKSTIADLNELRSNGVADEIVRQAREGKSIVGICGGYQMMGRTIRDPHHIESALEQLPGLNLLPVETTIGPEKATVRTVFKFKYFDELCHGYEIHMGRTRLDDDAQPLNRLEKGGAEGCCLNQRIWGTYMHGILDNPVVIEDLLSPFVAGKTAAQNYDAFKQQQYDLLADHLRKYVDMDTLYKIME